MRFNILQLVEYEEESEGQRQRIIGRICKEIPPAFYCVKFEFGCMKMHENDLRDTDCNDGPLCDLDCNRSC